MIPSGSSTSLERRSGHRRRLVRPADPARAQSTLGLWGGPAGSGIELLLHGIQPALDLVETLPLVLDLGDDRRGGPADRGGPGDQRRDQAEHAPEEPRLQLADD